MHRYSLLAIDLDGTLLDSRGNVSDANCDAIGRAKAAGIRVCVCTGRGYNESKHISARIGQTDPVVVAGGAILADALTGRSLHRFCMRPSLVQTIVDSFVSHGHAALILKDACPVNDSGLHPRHDYLVVSPDGEKAIDPITRWWFKEHGIRTHIVPALADDEHPEHTVRVGICGPRRATAAAARDLTDRFAPEVTVHHFNAVVPGTHGHSTDDHIVILEAFDRTVSKWNAISWLGAQHGVDTARIAAIGNDINDIAMLQAAACSVAMGNAVPEAAAVAKHHTLDNDSDGVAHAIDRILAGEW